jgi:hypothetical protein
LSGVPSLDSFGEIYPGFGRHRATLKAVLPNAERAWRQLFEVVARSEEFYQRREEDVARETMRLLLLALP